MVEHASDTLMSHEYVHDQDTEDCAWLINARWFTGALLVIATAAGARILGLPGPETGLYAIGAVILLYNGVFAWLAQRSRAHAPAHLSVPAWHLPGPQIILDWLALAVLIHLTGGIFSPAILFLLVHMLIAAVILRGWLPYVWVALDVGTLVLIAALEGAGAIPHYPLMRSISSAAYSDPVTFVVLVGSVLLAGSGISYTARNVMRRFRRSEDRICALLKTTRVVSSGTDTSELLESLACISIDSLSARGALIHLIEETSGSLTLASAHGMSEAFLKHATAGLSHHVFETEIVAGKPVIINDVARDTRVWQPRPLADEGIRSMIAAPIMGRAQALGVLCIYSDKPQYFSTSDADFVLAIGRQGGSALEHAMAYGSLQKAGQERAQFVTMVTHELRAPVAGTQVLLKTLVRGIAGDLNDQQRDILVRIEKRIEMLMSLVDDLLKLAASKTTDVEEPLQRVLLRPILRQVVDRFGKEAEINQVSVTLDIPFEGLSVRATELGLKRVMDNLVGNAVKYTPAGGHVCVNVVERPAGVVITVSDTGIGIPEQDLPCVMDGFFRARNARESGIVGTGLGLSIVKQFIDFFGGSISVDSVLGKGTTFKVTLQRAGPADQPAPQSGGDAGP